MAELLASTGRTLLASRRPRRHGRHCDSCLGHLSCPAEATQCPEDPHDEMWKRGDSSTGGELCPGSLLRSALEDRRGGPRCSSWPRRDPDRGLRTCPRPQAALGPTAHELSPGFMSGGLITDSSSDRASTWVQRGAQPPPPAHSALNYSSVPLKHRKSSGFFENVDVTEHFERCFVRQCFDREIHIQPLPKVLRGQPPQAGLPGVRSLLAHSWDGKLTPTQGPSLPAHFRPGSSTALPGARVHPSGRPHLPARVLGAWARGGAAGGWKLALSALPPPCAFSGTPRGSVPVYADRQTDG